MCTQVVDINVTLSAPKVIIPESGKLEENGPLIVADLGRLTLTTEVGSRVTSRARSRVTARVKARARSRVPL